jgi:hypothetical protein
MIVSEFIRQREWAGADATENDNRPRFAASFNPTRSPDMEHGSPNWNPFMLMTHPEVVLAAIENSENLGRLNRHLCRPLDKPLIPGRADEVSAEAEVEAEADEDRGAVAEGEDAVHRS